MSTTIKEAQLREAIREEILNELFGGLGKKIGSFFSRDKDEYKGMTSARRGSPAAPKIKASSAKDDSLPMKKTSRVGAYRGEKLPINNNNIILNFMSALYNIGDLLTHLKNESLNVSDEEFLEIINQIDNPKFHIQRALINAGNLVSLSKEYAGVKNSFSLIRTLKRMIKNDSNLRNIVKEDLSIKSGQTLKPEMKAIILAFIKNDIKFSALKKHIAVINDVANYFANVINNSDEKPLNSYANLMRNISLATFRYKSLTGSNFFGEDNLSFLEKGMQEVVEKFFLLAYENIETYFEDSEDTAFDSGSDMSSLDASMGDTSDTVPSQRSPVTQRIDWNELPWS